LTYDLDFFEHDLVCAKVNSHAKYQNRSSSSKVIALTHIDRHNTGQKCGPLKWSVIT